MGFPYDGKLVSAIVTEGIPILIIVCQGRHHWRHWQMAALFFSLALIPHMVLRQWYVAVVCL